MKKAPINIFNFISVPVQIREASNVVRWNPSLAISWMEEVLPKVISPIWVSLWNASASKINETINSIEATRYYSEATYWDNKPNKRLTLIEEDISLEDYIALQQFSSQN